MQYIFLVLAIVFEVIGTTAMAASQQFTKIVPVVILVVSYGLAFYFLSVTLKTLPVGIAYAMWSGLGIVFISLVGYVAIGQKLDFAAVIGMSMIIGGVIVIQLFSKSAGH
ncbi:DMT family transporter [Celeribacter marinus]|uniref:Ethidium bromide-methyl viologen resistance protein EmrE n=1 Tax=Celeribacter marinus TaxID=1397108 RepID=A0A0P0A9R0_9RHOB|nr:SMR family transporter [Celeribacter marinus]ALI54585.1 ethidium bromide-methyl viologen resistance protein EmrE [Celeribacter marinus]SFK50177.1 small multidrug resistance pump [Celeribacter marinus]